VSLSSDKNGTSSTTATTISSIGLSPLLIGISGILHEAYIFPMAHNTISSRTILLIYLLWQSKLSKHESPQGHGMAYCSELSSHCTHWPRHHGFWCFSFQRSERQTQHLDSSESRHNRPFACLGRALRMEYPFPASEPANSQCSRLCWWHEGKSYRSPTSGCQICDAILVYNVLWLEEHLEPNCHLLF
jgi:hypothetical protein